MSEVQRYWASGPVYREDVPGQGEWVRHEDHAAALAAKDAEIREMVRLIERAHELLEDSMHHESLDMTDAAKLWTTHLAMWQDRMDAALGPEERDE